MRTWFWTRTSASSWSTLAQRRTWCLGNCLEHSVVPWNTAALKFCWETGINKRIFMVLLDLKECYSILVTILISFTVDNRWGTWIYFQIWRPRAGDVVHWGDIIHTGLWRKPFLWCWGDHQREAEATISGLKRWAEIFVQVHSIYLYCKFINSCFMLCEGFHIVLHL